MSTLYALADWIFGLNPFALAGLVCALIVALMLLSGLAWLFIYGAMSGAGETNDGEVETEEDLK